MYVVCCLFIYLLFIIIHPNLYVHAIYMYHAAGIPVSLTQFHVQEWNV